MGGFVTTLFGDGREIRDAEKRLIERENEVFDLQQQEDTDLGIHVRYDLIRHRLLNERGALNRAIARQNSNRNLVAIGGVLVLLLLDHHLPWADLMAWLTK